MLGVSAKTKGLLFGLLSIGLGMVMFSDPFAAAGMMIVAGVVIWTFVLVVRQWNRYRTGTEKDDAGTDETPNRP